MGTFRELNGRAATQLETEGSLFCGGSIDEQKWYDWIHRHGDNAPEMKSRPVSRSEMAGTSIGAFRDYTSKDKIQIFNLTVLNFSVYVMAHLRALKSFCSSHPIDSNLHS